MPHALLALIVATVSQLASIVADPSTINLGFIEPRSTITRTFRLVNTGSAPVTIASAAPTCTCTTVDATGKVIPAAGVLEIPLTMKVAASTGVKVAAVTFTFAGGQAPVTVEMKGEIAYPVRATAIDFTNGATVPYINAFGDPARPQGTAKPPLTGEVTVTSIDGKPFRVLSVMGRAPEFAAPDTAATNPKSVWKVRYNFEGIPCEQMPPYLVIATDHPSAPVIDVRVRHQCTKISPTLPFAEFRSNLGTIAPTTPLPFEFELKTPGWTVTQVQSKDARMKIDLVGQRVDAEHGLVSLVATAAASTQGIVLLPVTMTAIDPTGATRSSDFWVYANVVPAASTQNAGS